MPKQPVKPSTSTQAKLPLPYLCFAVCCFALPFFLFLNPSYWYRAIGPVHVQPPLYPFLDMQARLAHFEMHHKGWDVYKYPNPLDPMGRVNKKPAFTLILGNSG